MSNPRHSDSTDCIIMRQTAHEWRVNPDEFIYISFSLEQFHAAYGEESIVKTLHQGETIVPFSDDVQSEYRRILMREWRTRASMPIRPLSPNASTEEIKNKNVFFIFGRTHSTVLNAQHDGETAAFSYPYNEAIPARAHYKVTLLPYKTPAEIDNRDINTLLHESAHAFEFKHFRKYDQGFHQNSEHPPYCELDCEDTVMAYHQDCKRVSEAADHLPGPRRMLRVDDQDPSVQADIKKIFSAFPTQLGPLDLEAAKRVKEMWKERKNEKAKTEKPAPQGRDHSELMRHPQDIPVSFIDFTLRHPWGWVVQKLNASVDYTIEQMREYATQVVAECPTYFPNPTYWRDYHSSTPTFFNGNFTANAGSTPAIAPSSPVHTISS